MAWVAGDYCVAGFEGERGCRVPPARIGVCIDRFEYPNQSGVLPAVMGTFDEAEEACAVEGKRLCSDSEWTLACRGTVELSACAFGFRGPRVRLERLWDSHETGGEVERVDGRRASTPGRCVSAHAVFDLPGNVEEWARSEAANGYQAVLKGGHFNKGSIGCERSVYTRQVYARSPFVGFRCCREPLVSPPALPF
jgi:formylglycine-generating enzyme required for sulfatase activity